MIAGSIPAASAQPEERDVPEVDFGVEDKVLYEAVQPTGRGAETRPDPIRAEAVTTGAEVSKTNASAWHAAGFRGAVKVGIIDAFSATVWNAAQAAGEVPAPAGTFCRDGGAACDIWTVDPGALFGTAVAEIIHEMAPDASLYLARPITLGDYAALLDYFAAQGVQIIYNGLTVSYGSPGDGTGFEADLVDDAVSAGMMWVNWVGDLANGGYWRGTWVDASGDGYLDFAPGTNEMGFFCGPGYGLRWSDWTANPTDYHVYIYEDLDAVATRTVKASSTRAQVTGSAPWEDYNPSLSAAGCPGLPTWTTWRSTSSTRGTARQETRSNSALPAEVNSGTTRTAPRCRLPIRRIRVHWPSAPSNRRLAPLRVPSAPTARPMMVGSSQT
jgi:hypothetical protein